MTFLRRKALEISSWVTWLAAPGCKEWAEGLEREVAFIESDWRALVWAIGSTGVVFDRRYAPIRSLAEVPTAAKAYFDARRSLIALTKMLCCLFGFLLAIAVFTLVSVHRYTMDDLCACLIVGAAAFFFFRARKYAKSVASQPDDIGTCAANFRAELQRDIDFNCGFATCATVGLIFFAFLLDSYGVHDSVLASLRDNRISFLCLIMPAVQVCIYRRKLKIRIAELSALIARGAEGVSL